MQHDHVVDITNSIVSVFDTCTELHVRASVPMCQVVIACAAHEQSAANPGCPLNPPHLLMRQTAGDTRPLGCICRLHLEAAVGSHPRVGNQATPCRSCIQSVGPIW